MSTDLVHLFGGDSGAVSPPKPTVESDDSTPQSNVCSPPGAPETPSRASEPVVVTETTPAGLIVEFQASPKRLYRVNGKEVPSVTTILGCLDKPALPWWGMKVGVEGVVELCREGVIRTASLDGDHHYFWPRGNAADLTAADIVSLLTEHKLTVNHVKEKAGDRGSSVHKAFETWAENGTLPNPETFPENEQGYVRALRKFIEESKIVPHLSEVMVGSKKHGYAGRYDLQALYGGHEVCVHLTPQKEKYAALEPGLWMLDLKTSSGVYPTHFFQLEAYEEASVECGYEPTSDRGVVHVCADGRYEVKKSPCSFADFKAILGAYRAVEKTKVPR